MTTQQASVILENMQTSIDAGNTLLGAFKYENAVTNYQVVVDQLTAFEEQIPANSYTAQADAVAIALKNTPSHLASQATATSTGEMAQQIHDIAVQAYNATPPSPGGQHVGGPITATSPTGINLFGTNVGFGQLLLWGLAAAAAGGLAYWLYTSKPRGAKRNPTRGSAGPKRKSGKALINKGRSCLFVMKDGSERSCAGGMMHDPSGKWWPRTSVICGPFQKGDFDDDVGGDARHYLGSTHRTRVGSINLPPRSTSSWQYIGDVEEIFYTRAGRKNPGRYRHPFNKPGALATIVKGKGRVRLYRRGRFYRVDLPRGAILDSRGYVWP